VILIAGLGNPGSEYENTRHNLGFNVIDTIASRYRIKLRFNKKMYAHLGKGCIDSEDILLVKPASFVNQSGEIVVSLVKYFQVPVRSGLIVICDDINLPFGKIRIREKGSSGGHKGLESIIKELGDSNFIRIRIGVGRPATKEDVAEYVLSEFKQNELKIIREAISKAGEAITVVINEGVKKSMSIYNGEA